MILESTKVIIDNLPKEEWWNSSLVTSIIGSIVGGLLAFWIAYIQIDDQRKQQDEQRKLEIQKMKVEIEIEELNQDLEVLNEIYITSCSICNYYRNEKREVDTTGVDFKIAYIKAVDLVGQNFIKIQHKTYSKNIKKMVDNFNNNINKDLSLFRDGGLIEACIRESWRINMSVSYTLITTDIPQEKLRLLDSIGK